MGWCGWSKGLNGTVLKSEERGVHSRPSGYRHEPICVVAWASAWGVKSLSASAAVRWCAVDLLSALVGAIMLYSYGRWKLGGSAAAVFQ